MPAAGTYTQLNAHIEVGVHQSTARMLLCSACVCLSLPTPDSFPPACAPLCRSYIEAFVRAADQVGVGACVAAAVLNSTGAVQAWAQMHTLSAGPPLASLSSTSGSTGGTSSSSGGTGGTSGGSGGGSGSTGGTYGSSGGGSGSAGNSSSSGVLSGSAESSWVLTLDTAECSTFTPPYGWQDDTQAWGERTAQGLRVES